MSHISFENEDGTSDLADQEAIDLYVRKVGPAKFEALKVHMREVAQKIRDRDEYHKEVAIRPLTPTQDTFKALDEEVELKQAKNILILEDFSEPDPFEGMSFKQKMLKRYLTLPEGNTQLGTIMELDRVLMVQLETLASTIDNAMLRANIGKNRI